MIPNPRYQLPGNDDLFLQRRTFGGVDRTWSKGEFERIHALAIQQGREDFASVLLLGRYTGLRIHECFRIDTAAAAKAVKEGALTIKGKGGLVRTVPLNELLIQRLQHDLRQIPRGHKLFVPDDQQTHEVIKRLQAFIWVYRPLVQDSCRAAKGGNNYAAR